MEVRDIITLLETTVTEVKMSVERRDEVVMNHYGDELVATWGDYTVEFSILR